VRKLSPTDVLAGPRDGHVGPGDRPGLWKLKPNRNSQVWFSRGFSVL